MRFTETIETLLGRFRRVVVEQEAPVSAGSLPDTWLGWRSEGSRVSFVDSAYRAEATERSCRERFPSATVQAHPMTLREIFISLARPGRNPTQGIAP